MIFFYKFVPGWLPNVNVIDLLTVKLKLMNPNLVLREFGVEEDAEQDLKRSSSTSFKAIAGSTQKLFQMTTKPV